MQRFRVVRSSLVIGLILLATSAFGTGCIFTSLHSPLPNEPGEVTVGVHGGYAGVSTGAPLASTVFRVGLFEGAELGANIGNLGVDVAFKYGFLDHDDAFQLSVIGGLGLYGYQLFDPSIGALIGYNIGKVFMPYVGFREHFVVGAGGLPISDAIGGVELFLGSVVSLMFELDYTFVFGSEESSEDLISDVIGIAALNVGINFSFGGGDD